MDIKELLNGVDCTCGRKTRCVIITDSDHVILSALQAETVAGRLNGVDGDDGSREDAEYGGAHEKRTYIRNFRTCRKRQGYCGKAPS